MRVLTPSGRFESRSTPSVAAERRAIKAVVDAASEYGPVAKGFLTGNAALMGGGSTPGAVPVGSRPNTPGTSWSNQGNALIARVNQHLQSSFGQTTPELEAALAQSGQSWGPPFPPGRPLDPFWGYRRPPRTWDFAVGENVQLTPRWNRVSFQTLKALYEKYDVAQICVRHLIDDVRSLELNWLPPKNCKDDVSEDIEAAEQFWAYPDRRQPFDCWLAEWLQDVLRYDAGALFIRETEAGDPYAIEVVSGETIIPLIDFFGRRPSDEEEAEGDGEIEGDVTPAFLQIIEGLPWDWLTADQMIYQPLWPLPESQYGQCPLESILLSANTDLRFQWHFLQYFTEGTLPAGFMEAPPDLSDPAQVQHWQEHWDGLMLGDQAKLNQIRWVPSGSKFAPAKAAAEKFDETFPLYLMRRTCAAYKITPTDLGFTETVNRASSEIQVDVQARVGRGPVIRYIEGVVNLITTQRLGLRARMQIEASDEVEDRVAVAQAHSIYIEKGVESPDEVRAELGKPINKETPFPRFIDNARSGPISELAIASQAGKIDPETYGRDKTQELVNTAYASPPGTLPPQGSPEQKAAAETTAQASRDLIEATTGKKPPTAPAESGADGAPAPGEGGADGPPVPPDAAAKAIAAVEPLGWRAVLAVIDAVEKNEATGGITAATGVQGVDFQGSEDEDDDEEDTAKKAAEVALEMRRWRENARNRLKKGRAPRRFASTVLSQQQIDQVWASLQKASSREEVDAAFAGLGKPSAGERPAFHSQADRIVGHYSGQIAKALATLFTAQQITSAIEAARAALPELTAAEKAAVWDKATAEMTLGERAYRDGVLCTARPSEDRAKSSPAGPQLLKDVQLDLAVQAARQVLESEGASTDELHTVLVAMYGDGFLQGAHDAMAAAGGDVLTSLADAMAAPAAGYWDAWTPGYGQAAAQAADGGMRALLDKGDITIQGLTDESIDRIGNTISGGLSKGDSVQTVGKAVREVVESPARAQTIANTEYARAMTTASVETYEANQVAQVTWLAEDDACPECEANADGSPYELGDAPQPPAHPNCRCALAPSIDLPG